MKLTPMGDSPEEIQFEIRAAANPALLNVLDQIQAWHDTFARNTLVAHWKLGMLIKQVYDDVEHQKGRKYGAGAFKNINRYFAWDEGMARNAMRFAMALTKEELDELCALRKSNGEPIYYSHALSLMSISDPDKRQELLTEMLRENWDTRTLNRAVIKSAFPGKKEDDKRGRPLSCPGSLSNMVNQQMSITKDFLRRAEEVWQNPEIGLHSKAESVNPKKVSDKLLDELEAHAQMLGELSEKAIELQRDAFAVHQLLSETRDKAQGRSLPPKAIQSAPRSSQRVTQPSDDIDWLDGLQLAVA